MSDPIGSFGCMSKHAFVVDISGMESAEQWRPIPGFAGKYEASSLGRIRSKRCVLKQRLNYRGYPVVELSKPPGSQESLVHRLVASAFHGVPTDGLECRHMDGNKTNNRAENLAWGTHSENAMDQVRHGTHRNTKKTHCDRGHEFTVENTYWRSNTHRTCLTCKRLMENRGYYRRRGLTPPR